MRIATRIGVLMCSVCAIGSTIVAVKRDNTKKKEQSQTQQKQKASKDFVGGAKEFKPKQDLGQKTIILASDSQGRDLKMLLDKYNKATTVRAKVRIGSYLMPLAEKYISQLTQRNVLSSLLRDKQEMELIGNLATVVGDLQGNIRDVGTGIFMKIKKDIQQIAQNILTETTYE